jgi:hypothetical protein
LSLPTGTPVSNLSLPGPPSIMSLPPGVLELSPLIVSLPPLPKSMSLPSSPSILSAPGPPFTVSTPSPPLRPVRVPGSSDETVMVSLPPSSEAEKPLPVTQVTLFPLSVQPVPASTPMPVSVIV